MLELFEPLLDFIRYIFSSSLEFRNAKRQRFSGTLQYVSRPFVTVGPFGTRGLETTLKS